MLRLFFCLLNCRTLNLILEVTRPIPDSVVNQRSHQYRVAATILVVDQ